MDLRHPLRPPRPSLPKTKRAGLTTPGPNTRQRLPRLPQKRPNRDSTSYPLTTDFRHLTPIARRLLSWRLSARKQVSPGLFSKKPSQVKKLARGFCIDI